MFGFGFCQGLSSFSKAKLIYLLSSVLTIMDWFLAGILNWLVDFKNTLTFHYENWRILFYSSHYTMKQLPNFKQHLLWLKKKTAFVCYAESVLVRSKDDCFKINWFEWIWKVYQPSRCKVIFIFNANFFWNYLFSAICYYNKIMGEKTKHSCNISWR